MTAGSDPPLGLYIHWPYCARICPYCDFNVVRARGRSDEEAALVEAIAADMNAQAAMIGPRTLVSIFFGGGTPSLMAPEAAARLIALAKTLWPGDGPVEISLEANPTDAEVGRFRAFAEAGVQRLSLGVQAFDDADLAFLGRNHGADEAIRAAEVAGRLFPRLSLDLIYALPGQHEPAWRETLKRGAGLGAEHLSPYQLTIEAGTPFDRAIRRGRFTPANEDTGAALYEATQETLEALGYTAYEVSNHARGQDGGMAAQARHNLVYWRGEDYIGVGPGAHGRLTRPDGVRLASEADHAIGAYMARVAREGAGATFEALPAIEVAQERVLMGLRTLEGVALSTLKPLDLASLDDLRDDGLISLTHDRLIATPRGRLVLDRLTAEVIGRARA